MSMLFQDIAQNHSRKHHSEVASRGGFHCHMTGVVMSDDQTCYLGLNCIEILKFSRVFTDLRDAPAEMQKMQIRFIECNRQHNEVFSLKKEKIKDGNDLDKTQVFDLDDENFNHNQCTNHRELSIQV